MSRVWTGFPFFQRDGLCEGRKVGDRDQWIGLPDGMVKSDARNLLVVEKNAIFGVNADGCGCEL